MYMCVCARVHVYIYVYTMHRCSRTVMCTAVRFTTCPVQPAGDDIGCTHMYINTEMHICACACVRMRMPVYVCMCISHRCSRTVMCTAVHFTTRPL